MFENAAGTAVIIAFVLVPLLGLVVWVVKRLVPAIIRNMDANTAALAALSKTLEKFISVWNERDVRLFLQLDRIEQNTKK